jgi:hypothetical protein
MRYPTLSTKDAHAFSVQVTKDARTANSVAAAAFCAEYAGSLSTIGSADSKPIDLSAIEQVAKEAEKVARSPEMATAAKKERERVESELCGPVHKALCNFPIEMLDDQRFWRYLAVRYFGEFIVWRESEALTNGNISTYFTAGTGVESLPLRLFLRGQAIISSKGTYELASAVPAGTDFWRSHILRVRTGRAAPLARSFTEMQSQERMTTAPLRQLAKLINRMWANVVLTEYGPLESTALIKRLREKVEETTD